jgi:hypothetical protein
MSNALDRSPDYVIFQDKWAGKLRWQGHSNNGEEWLPVAPPANSRLDAIVDCRADWKQQGKANEPFIAPTDRQHNWTGNRQYL